MNTLSETISVAMATYNGMTYLREQLESIIEQTLPPSEIIVVDDCSTDGTLELLDSMAKLSKVPIKIFVNEKNQGSTASFSRALAETSGEFILFADQDDVWEPLKIAKMLTFVKQGHFDGVFSDASLVDQDLKPLGKRLLENSRLTQTMRILFAQGKGLKALHRYNVVTGATMMIRSPLKSWILPIPKEWVHDYWTAYIVSALGCLALLEEPLIKYRQHGKNQIGLKKDFKNECSSAKSKHHTMYLEEARHIELLKNRLVERGGVSSSVIKELEEKILFLKRRFRLRDSILDRFPLFLYNLMKRSYFAYGQGWRPLLKDLIL